MFKSKFANALTTMDDRGPLELRRRRNNFRWGTARKAGHMDPVVAKNVRALLQEFICDYAK